MGFTNIGLFVFAVMFMVRSVKKDIGYTYKSTFLPILIGLVFDGLAMGVALFLMELLKTGGTIV